jgi:hypothetical protein
MIDLQSPIPANMSKEWVSIAFVRALCAQAGLNISSWEWDDGLDLTVGSAKRGYAGVTIRNVKFHLQVKSTTDWKVVDGKIAFRIKKAKYNQLAEKSVDPQHLVLYTLPPNRAEWIKSLPNNAVLNHCAYFLSFDRLKPLRVVDPEEKATIHLSTTNRLTAGELVRLYREAASDWVNGKG